jgi:Spy/CpxP family protein refolding chaperone
MNINTNKIPGALKSFSIASLFLVFSFVPALAQDQAGTVFQLPPCAGDKPLALRSLDEILCLENEQRRSIRLINQEMKPQLDIARRRVQFAQRALDEAIYGDNASDEATIEQRAKDLASAQGEFARIRSLTDFRIRRVLTLEQVKRFRLWREWRIRQNNIRLQRALQNNRRNQNNLQQQNNKQNNRPQRPLTNRKP